MMDMTIKNMPILYQFDNLIHRHEVMPLIVAFTNGVNRNPEYGANPKQAQFWLEDLLPVWKSLFHNSLVLKIEV